MKKILVSACLLGVSCRYDGKSKPCGAVDALKEKYQLIPICPEVMGGLETPRIPSELKDGRAFRKDGTDITEQCIKGANEALRLAEKFGCKAAVLKERSPSCVSGSIYDGTFTGRVVSGDGIAAAVLKNNGIKVFGESQLAELEEFLKTEKL